MKLPIYRLQSADDSPWRESIVASPEEPHSTSNHRLNNDLPICWASANMNRPMPATNLTRVARSFKSRNGGNRTLAAGRERMD